MKKQVNKQFIEDIATELDIEPSFIEKDFYAVKILKELATADYNGAKLVFTGGTCLSKGYNLIKRFSEDIDFRIVTGLNFSRNNKKKFRDFIIEKISSLPDFKYLEETLEKKNESKFFSFYVEYPKEFSIDNSLREGLKLEFTFENVLLPTKICNIESIIGKYIDDAETSNIECISPVEVAADKFSALMWRVDIKDRTQPQGSTANDATIIRHLHDLAALEKSISKNDFKKCIKKSFDTDKGRGGSTSNIDLIEFAKKTLNKLKTDNLYAKEYKDFVEALSYAENDEAIFFESALNAFGRITSLLADNKK